MTPKALSREIKFRAWGTEYGGGETKMRYSDESPDVPCFWTLYVGNKQEYAEAIMQYTGLHDKNGKEIYEGDKIVGPMYAINSFVMFDERYATFKAQSGTQLIPLGYECQIIGNIYESLTKENK